MSHIIDPKTEKAFPTAVEFHASIKVYKDEMAVVGVCRHCGGKVGGHIKAKGVEKLTEERVNQIALSKLAEHHACPRKQASWGEKGLLTKIAPDIVRGWEKLQEKIFKDKRAGRA